MDIINYFASRNIKGGGVYFQAARQALYSKGIKTSYEPIPGEQHNIDVSSYDDINNTDHVNNNESKSEGIGKRIVFYLSSIAQADIMTQSASGLVLERDTWKPLVIPPYSSVNAQANSSVDSYIIGGLYDIIPMLDGTMIHIYWFDGAWRISTSKSYDNTDVIFTNTTLTHKQLFDEVLQGCDLISMDEFTSHLDKECSYTLIIVHPDVHLYWKSREVRYHIHLVQRAHLPTFNRYYNWSNDSKDQNEYLTKIPIQKPVDLSTHGIKKVNLAVLKKICDNKTHILSSKTKTTTTPIVSEYSNELVNMFQFGVMLRSKDPIMTSKLSYLNMDSTMLNHIKHMLYDHTMLSQMRPQFDRENFVILHAYLSRYYHSVFLELLPQYSATYTDISARINSLIGHLIRYYTSEKTVKNGGQPLKITSKQPDVVLAIKTRIDEITDINVDNTEECRKILLSYLLDSNMTSMMYPYIFV